jgi:hypothetical protein
MTKAAAENAAIWLGVAVFFALLTIAPKAEDRDFLFFKIVGALIAAICVAFAVLNMAMPPGPWGF